MRPPNGHRRPLTFFFYLLWISLLSKTLAFSFPSSNPQCRLLQHPTSLYAVIVEENSPKLDDVDLPVNFDREFLEEKYRNDGTLNRRWAEFLQQTAPFVQQAATLWARGQLRRDDPRLAESARETLTNLGPAFVKLGQILSVREDVLGEVWSAELAKLQNSVTAFGGPEAVDEALSPDIRAKLLSFDPAPIAVASIAQVHKGTWRNDEDGSTTEVAVKVLRPNVASQVGVDLCVLLRAGDILSEWVPRILPVSRVDWEALLAGLAQGLWEEVDLSGEAQRQTRFAANMEPVPRVFVPRVMAYNSDILISEWVDGTPLRSLPSMDNRLKEAQALMRDAYCKSMYVDAFFHADGHGGNLLWVEPKTSEEEGELCILDCGLMVDIEREAAEGLLRLSLHLAARDWTSVVEDVIDLGFLPKDLSPQLQAEARGIARRIIGPYLDVGGGAKAASVYSISSLFDDVSAATLKLPTALPPDMILLARAVIQLEGLALRAYPDYRLVDDILPVAARIALRSGAGLDDDGEARTSLLYDLLYETKNDTVFRGSGETFSLDKLLNLLDTATGSQSESTVSIDRLFNELVKADAARDLIADEALNIGDAMVRDAVWRSIDTLAERGPRLPLPRPPFLPAPLSVLEKIAPRVTEKEQLVLVRLQEVLDELVEDESTPLPKSLERSLPFKDFPIYKMLRASEVRQNLGEITANALLNREESARGMAEAITEKLRDRVQTRLATSGLVEPDVAEALSKAVFLPRVGQTSTTR